MPSAARAFNPRTVRTLRNIVALSCLVVAVVVAFSLLVGHAASKPSNPGTFGAVALPARAASPDFGPLIKGNQVPGNVLGALFVPAGSTVVSRTSRAIEAPFDGTVTYTSVASPATIAKFFPAELAQQRWRVIRHTNPVLAIRAGTDGNYWEVGVTISNLSTAGSHSDGAQFKMELYTYQPGS